MTTPDHLLARTGRTGWRSTRGAEREATRQRGANRLGVGRQRRDVRLALGLHLETRRAPSVDDGGNRSARRSRWPRAPCGDRHALCRPVRRARGLRPVVGRGAERPGREVELGSGTTALTSPMSDDAVPPLFWAYGMTPVAMPSSSKPSSFCIARANFWSRRRTSAARPARAASAAPRRASRWAPARGSRTSASPWRGSRSRAPRPRRPFLSRSIISFTLSPVESLDPVLAARVVGNDVGRLAALADRAVHPRGRLDVLAHPRAIAWSKQGQRVERAAAEPRPGGGRAPTAAKNSTLAAATAQPGSGW